MPRNDRRLLYSTGYVAALLRARADLFAQHSSHLRDYATLQRELVELRQEIAELRALAGVRDPALPLN